MSCFVLWCGHSRDSNGYWILLCNCLVGVLPYSHYVMRSFPLCGVRVFYPAQYDVLDNNHHGEPPKKKEKVRGGGDDWDRLSSGQQVKTGLGLHS